MGLREPEVRLDIDEFILAGLSPQAPGLAQSISASIAPTLCEYGLHDSVLSVSDGIAQALAGQDTSGAGGHR